MSGVRARLESLFGARHVDELASPHLERTLPRLTPPNEELLCEALRASVREGWKVLPLGLCTKLALSPPRGAIDFALSCSALQGIVEYEPDEGVITALAGTRLDTLHDALRSNGHWLSPDLPTPARTTLGGAIGAGLSGHDRLRFGPLRRQVLGLRVALGDGTITKSGGRLVKNVTGYDLHRLYTGSQGTLCVILEASLRLHARPSEERWIEIDAGTDPERTRLVALAHALPLRVVSLIDWREPRGQRWLAVRLIERPDVIAEHERVVLAAWSGARVLAGEAARARADEVRELSAGALLVPHAPHEPSAAERRISIRLKQALDPHDVFVARHFATEH